VTSIGKKRLGCVIRRLRDLTVNGNAMGLLTLLKTVAKICNFLIILRPRNRFDQLLSQGKF
jgi:hypothetical protein